MSKKEKEPVIDNNDDIEEIELTKISDTESSSEEDEDSEEKGFHISFHLIFLVLALFLIGGMIFYLIRWNGRSAVVDTSDILPDEFDMENLDYYVYPDPQIMATREDDGENNILFIGNSILSNNGEDNSLINAIKAKLPDANIYSIISDVGKITSDRVAGEGYSSINDSIALVPIVNGLVNKEFNPQVGSVAANEESIFYKDSSNRSKEFLNTWTTVDLDKIDTVVIMYSFIDYYEEVPTLVLENEAINCYYGALFNAVKMLKDAYPHLSIVLATPTPGYLLNDKGDVVLSNLQDFGMGNSSAYVDMMYYVSTKFCVSFIDNYFYGITDENITEYVDNFNLTDKGIKLVSTHIVNFLENKPEKSTPDMDNE